MNIHWSHSNEFEVNIKIMSFAIRKLIVALTIVLIIQQISKANALINFKSLVCTVADPELIDVKVCEVQKNSNGQNEAHFRSVLKKTVKDCTVTLKILRNSNGWSPAMTDLKVDFCYYMENASKFPLLSKIHDQVKAHTSVNHTCPYKKGEELIVDSLPEKNSLLGDLSFSAGEYSLIADFVVQNKMIGRVNFTGNLS